MDEAFRWFTKSDLREYQNQYVCLVGRQVVASDEDPEVAYNRAKVNNPGKEVVLWKVPRGETFIF